MKRELPKNYSPKDMENAIYERWEKNGYFRAEVDRSKEPFTIVMPPPNITGQLHMGHALDNTLQDILTRFKRMQGYNALWLPGTDHASIATEAKVVEKLREQGISKEDLGREAFLEKVWDWKREYGSRITSQLRRMGSSADWSRERFTMDEGCNKAVREVFVRLYDKNLIYRGERIINWCPKCLTSISDAEVEYEEQQGHFWHLRYPLSDGSGYIQMATTRPETMLGDTAVAVNPEDDRYKDYVGKTVILPIVHREIPIIADSYVDMEFGTGVVKITPAHDPNDFEVGLRHKLPVINVLTEDAKITDDYPEFAGMDRYEAREAVVEALKKEGALVKIEDHAHNVGTCYRCHTTVEPRVSKQWFVAMETLAKPAIDAVKNGDMRFVPEHFDKTYFHWLENIRDWCISRQLWWGHRIPAFYCDDCGEMTVTRESSCNCPKCQKPMRQDPDTLDTWFSSALWPFSTLGWPEKTEDFDYFYPTSVLVTGYDIIFFWVIRMVFSGLEHTGTVPFHTVFIHGLVRDSLGRKMSKSLGNGIDPLEIIDKYGADALRLTLVTGNAPGNDMRFYYEKVEASRNFANKIWNAARYIMMKLDDRKISTPDINELHTSDKWILSEVNSLVRAVTENMDKYELGIAVQKIYDFIWDEFCDWYIEITKLRTMDGGDERSANAALWTLRSVLVTALKLLHPFMPFITEEIFCTLQDEEETIMLSEWPKYREDHVFTKEVRAIALIKQLVRGVRDIRKDMEAPNSRKTRILIVSEDDEVRRIFDENNEVFINLASATDIEVLPDRSSIPADAVSIVIEKAVVYLPLDELVDFEKERARLKKEKDRLLSELDRSLKMLSNEKFISKAPADKVEDEKGKQLKYQKLLEEVEKRLGQL